MVFPPGYSSPFVETASLNGGDMASLWQGIYMQRLQVRLPPSFKKAMIPPAG
jgi:hypothetical protein